MKVLKIIRIITIIIIIIIININYINCDEKYNYDIVWNDVPATANTNERVIGDVDIGTCLCDLTLNSCDYNCKCDSDCTEQEMTRFSGSEREGRSKFNVFKCIDPDLVDVNERGDVHTAILDNLLCIQKDNNPSDGEFYDDLLTKDVNAEEYQFSTSTAIQNTVTCTSSQGSYSVDDSLRGAQLVNGILVATNSGLLPLPTRSATGECSSRNAPKYLRNINDNSASSKCMTTTHDLQTDCNNMKFTLPSNLYVATFCTSTFSFSGYIPIIYSPALVAPSFSSNTCSNIIKEVEYVFKIDATTGNITSAQANLVYDSITTQPQTTASIERQFTVFYNISGDETARPKSGNPGYLFGYPLLGGNKIDQVGVQKAIEQSKYNMSLLPHTINGICSSSGSLNYQVTFGENAIFSCLIPLTMNELKATCGQLDIANNYLSINASYIGMWGNSDYKVIGDWIEIDKTQTLSASPVSSWNDNTLTCEIVDSSFVEILYTTVGAIDNAQYKIVGARQRYPNPVKWTFLNTSTTQYFPINISVRFTKINPAYHQDIPATPPVLPRLPSDVLYPFVADDDTNSSSRTHGNISLVILLCIIVTLLNYI